MGLFDIFFGPFERFGMKGGFILLIIIAIIGAIGAAVMIVGGVTIAAGASFILDLTLTYGVLFLFLYVMWFRRPK